MSEFFKWTQKDYGLDVYEMDNEHKILIDKMNKLHSAAENKANFANLQSLVDDLAKYTVEHFKDEEAYMASIHFPGLDTHKVIHKQLLDKFAEHVAKFQETRTLGDDFFGFLKVWLSAHIRGIDMKYSDHSKSQGSAA